MELWKLLGIHPGIIALTGGGGKTTAMYTLARELSCHAAVICTTTTHIFPPDHLPFVPGDDLDILQTALVKHNCICTGTFTPEGKLTQPMLPLAVLSDLADYVLVEADGSRGLPVKAHLAHEPVIPQDTALTVTLLGASAFGRSVRDAVHRWEVFCRLTGAGPEDPVTPEDAAVLLTAEGLPDAVFVNQAEMPDAITQARRLAERIDCPVFAGSLRGGTWECLS